MQLRAESSPLLRGTQRVDFQPQALQAQATPDPLAHRQQFGITIRSGGAKNLCADLVKLPSATLLRALPPKHRPHVPQPHGRPIQQTVLQHRANDARRAFGTQAQHFTVAVLEGVHLLFDHIGGITDGPRKDLGLLDYRYANLVETIGCEDLANGALQPVPQVHIGWQNIVHTPD
jgi:hypothetical protein